MEKKIIQFKNSVKSFRYILFTVKKMKFKEWRRQKEFLAQTNLIPVRNSYLKVPYHNKVEHKHIDIVDTLTLIKIYLTTRSDNKVLNPRLCRLKHKFSELARLSPILNNLLQIAFQKINLKLLLDYYQKMKKVNSPTCKTHYLYKNKTTICSFL